ncbi:MAG: exopolysaccharide biosynthesis polyprenyl glycosylphosphotransferase [Rhizomicrobium sp.]
MSAHPQLAERPIWSEPKTTANAHGLTSVLNLADARAVIPARPAEISGFSRNPTRQFLKRVFDLSIALPLFVLLAPFMAAIAILIRLDSEGPVLFRQTRLGQDGKPFEIVKFRTMTVLEDGDCITQVCKGDARVTRVGRWLRRSSFDELPQFINVIAGEMSLVGPRPHAVAHDRLYSTLIENYQLRQQVKPGITGWAQVHGLRGGTQDIEDMRDRVTLDIWYARRASFALDLKILLRTPYEVLRQRNAY